MASSVDSSRIGFLVMAFAIVGLTGIFATYAGPVPLERAMAREATLDRALATGTAPDPKAALEALRPELGDSADTVIDGAGALAARVDRARLAMRAQFSAEAAALATRLRWIIGVGTATAALFGAAMLGVTGRRAPLPGQAPIP
jgi:hypothetical protein